jgi:hypothetical protein
MPYSRAWSARCAALSVEITSSHCLPQGLSCANHAFLADNYSKVLELPEWGSGVSLHGSNLEPPMSALGQKRTSTRLQPMSAIPPKADIPGRQLHVRFAFPALGSTSMARALDDLIAQVEAGQCAF